VIERGDEKKNIRQELKYENPHTKNLTSLPNNPKPKARTLVPSQPTSPYSCQPPSFWLPQ